MAPSVPLRGLDPDVDYKQFPQVTIDPEYQDEFADVTNQVRSREEWGAKPSTRAPTDRPLYAPVRYIVLSSFYTEQEGTPTRASIMQELQKRDMDLGLPDIQCK
ncbi:uncharacterized protein LOC128984858 [Macrosteles quadrilineatus]|uniref:uncharacterized protein LOC128984858 n=1 Tax=Macrosteles quadrilineatus TaxID=74068 RepID=UPI0023E10E4A|nr:uncharacterized protein LOC128984858 [Macrosteles quadrilineatus]